MTTWPRTKKGKWGESKAWGKNVFLELSVSGLQEDLRTMWIIKITALSKGKHFWSVVGLFVSFTQWKYYGTQSRELTMGFLREIFEFFIHNYFLYLKFLKKKHLCFSSLQILPKFNQLYILERSIFNTQYFSLSLLFGVLGTPFHILAHMQLHGQTGTTIAERTSSTRTIMVTPRSYSLYHTLM